MNTKMTFNEWWKSVACVDMKHCENCKIVRNCATVESLCRKSVYWCNNPSIESLCKCIAQSAYKAAQPHWTDVKESRPTEKDGKVITTHETDASFYSHEIKVIRVYVKLETQNPFNETRIDNFCLSTNKFEKYEDLVIAWMPLPEAPDNIDK